MSCGVHDDVMGVSPFGCSCYSFIVSLSSITMHVSLDHYKEKKEEENLYSERIDAV